LVQDLQLINEAVIPLHPIVPNPYTLLAQISSKAQYYSLPDLKDVSFAFLCILTVSPCLPLKTPVTLHSN
jgi:hypothetical protein